MNKFEEFDAELGTTIQNLLPDALCAKISVTFVDVEGAQCTLSFVREGFKDPDEDLDKEIKVDEYGDPLYPEEEE